VKLRTRLILASVAITSASTFLIGSLAVSTSHKSQIALLDKSLNSVASSIHGDSTSALSEGLYAVQQSDISLSLVYFSSNKQATVLNESKLKKVPMPGANELKDSYLQPQSHRGSENYRFKSVKLTQGEYVIVAGSLSAINSQYRSDRIRLLFLILFFLLLASLATWAFVQRDIQKIEDLIDSATEISNGNTEIEIAAGVGDSEVDQLSDALNRMVVALRRTAEIEEASSRRMQDFLGDASHELRTPLTVVKGYVELLSGTNLDDADQRKRAFSRVTSEILRMESLIKDLLFLAEFGMTPERSQEDVNFSEMLTSHVADFALLNSHRDISLDIEEGVHLQGSTSHLERLLANIFGNITRHTPSEAPVRVTLIKVGNGIEMCVEDGGPGLPDAAYSNGVQSFQRFDKSRSRENGGSGLGMSIIFAIVNEHDGKIVLGKSALGGLRIHVFFDNFRL